jgi:uncharacterized protein YbcC (UPF0753/DUF2309 family)
MGRGGLLCGVVICTHGFKSSGLGYSKHLDCNWCCGESQDVWEAVINTDKKENG